MRLTLTTQTQKPGRLTGAAQSAAASFITAGFLTTVFVVTLAAQNAIGQENTTESSQAKRVSDVRKWATATVGSLKLRNTSAKRELRQNKGSLLQWSNPIVGEVYGDSYLWTDQGRPAAFLSIYAKYDRPSGSRRLTFQSLSQDLVTARINETIIWAPAKSGVEFKQLKDVSAPNSRSSIRRLQMTKIVRQFRGRIQEGGDSERFRELRLLTTPLYKFESLSNNVEDGAMFAFVDGTDPELLILIESRIENEKRSWFMAPVRQNHRRLQLETKDQTFWDAPAIAPPFPNPKISNPKGTYFNTKWSAISDDDNDE